MGCACRRDRARSRGSRKLAEKEGGKTRAILEFLGRAVLAVGFLTFEGASWLLTMALMAIGFCAAVKGATERATLRYIRFRKRRRERRQHQIAACRIAWRLRRHLYKRALASANPHPMPSFHHGPVEIAYLDEGDGEPIVLVHGFASNKEVNWVAPDGLRR